MQSLSVGVLKSHVTQVRVFVHWTLWTNQHELWHDWAALGQLCWLINSYEQTL